MHLGVLLIASSRIGNPFCKQLATWKIIRIIGKSSASENKDKDMLAAGQKPGEKSSLRQSIVQDPGGKR